MPLIDELKTFFKGDIADDAATLARYSHDASLFEVRPSLVVFPKDSEDIKRLVAFAEKKKAGGTPVSLTARSAGTDMTGGPLTASIVVDMTRYFNHPPEIGDGYAVVEPGVFYRDFEKETLKKNWLLPSYPASREMCALGGMVANNSGGEKTLAYGKTEQYVEELRVVLSDGNEYDIRPLSFAELEEKKKEQTFLGEVYRKMDDLISKNYDAIIAARPQVSKNSTGYALWNVLDKTRGVFDLTKVFVGSQGTLGIITKIRVRLIHPKPFSRLVVIFLPSMSSLVKVTERVLAEHPESFESYDDHTFKVAVKFFPAVAKRFKAGIFRLVFQFLPEFWMVLTGGVPKLVLIAEFTGESASEAQAKAERVYEAVKALGFQTKVTRSAAEAEKYWTIRRESYNILRHHVKGLRTAPFIDDFVVDPESLGEFLPRLYAILDKYNLIYTVAGHVGNGNFHIIPLMDFRRPDAKEIIRKLGEEVYALVFQYHGSMSGEHNDGMIRGPYLREMYGDRVFALFQETKKIFDPDDMFNPGKKVEATFSDALAHIAAG